MDGISSVCTFCEQVIPPEVLARRHISKSRADRQMFCNQDCMRAWRKQQNFFQKMSHAGAEQRSQALRISNRTHPRRGVLKPRCRNCGNLLPPVEKRRGKKRIYCQECPPAKRVARKDYLYEYYHRKHLGARHRKRGELGPYTAKIPVSQTQNPREYHRWYRRLARRGGKPVEYWLEYDQRKRDKQ